MIDALFMPILKCVLSVFIWMFLGSAIGLGVDYIRGVYRTSVYHLTDLEDWSWAVAIISVIGMFTVLGVILNLKL